MMVNWRCVVENKENEELGVDSMKLLDKRRLDSKLEMDVLANLDEIKSTVL